MAMTTMHHIVLLYGDHENAFGQHPAYRNLISHAWQGLDLLEDEDAKPYADLIINQEIASFGGFTTFGRSGFISFPDQESLVAFLLKWG